MHRRVRALIRTGVVPGLLAVTAIAVSAVVGPATGQPAGVTVALDTDVSGNGPRTVGSIEGCVSIPANGEVSVDIAVPAPGIPSNQGIAGFEFGFFYDAQSLSVTGQNVDLLLAQAPGSSVLPFSAPLPSDTGDHELAVVDFGPSGIEPAGSSEIGPGVLARMTLRAKATGITPIAVRNIRLATDSLEIVDGIPAATGSVAVGVPCPAPSPRTVPAAQATTTAEPTSAPPAPSPTQRTGPAPATNAASRLAASGGPNAPSGDTAAAFMTAIGLTSAGVGATAMWLSRRTFRRMH
jgi:hypothetical protein